MNCSQAANGITSLQRLSRQSGLVETIPLIHDGGNLYHLDLILDGGNLYHLDLILDGGAGDLFRFGDGFFVGIPGGDTDCDGDVDLSDLDNLATHYGAQSGSRWSHGDFDLDGDTDLSDLGTLATQYGGGPAQALADFQVLTGVPEPAGIAIFVTAGALCSRNKRLTGDDQ